MLHLEEVFNVCQASNDCVLVEAVHGVGKSERIEKWTRKIGAELVTIHLANVEVGDMIGIPNIESDEHGNTQTVWAEPSWLVRLNEANWSSDTTIDDLEFKDEDFKKFVIEALE